MTDLYLHPAVLLVLILLGTGGAHPHNDSCDPVDQNPHKPRNVLEATDWLTRFGYISTFRSWSQGASALQALDEAIAVFQELAHINITGELDEATLEWMGKDRCGVPDVIRRKGQIRFTRNTGALKWKKHHLTYIVTQYTPDLPRGQVDQTLTEALQVWADVTPLTFTRSATKDHVDIEIKFVHGVHGDNNPFDGEGGVLAHAFFPPSYPGNVIGGDTHFDEAEYWTVDLDDEAPGRRLFCVAVHEFGHALGLDHSDQQGSIMWPWSQGCGNGTLDQSDIVNIQRLYGPPGGTTDPPKTTASSTTLKKKKKPISKPTTKPTTRRNKKPTTRKSRKSTTKPTLKPTTRSNKKPTKPTKKPIRPTKRPTTRRKKRTTTTPTKRPTTRKRKPPKKISTTVRPTAYDTDDTTSVQTDDPTSMYEMSSIYETSSVSTDNPTSTPADDTDDTTLKTTKRKTTLATTRKLTTRRPRIRPTWCTRCSVRTTPTTTEPTSPPPTSHPNPVCRGDGKMDAIDVASDGNTYGFKGTQIFRFKNGRVHSDYPKPIGGVFNPGPNSVDAVVSYHYKTRWTRRLKYVTYLFKDNLIWKYEYKRRSLLRLWESKVFDIVSGYPRDVAEDFGIKIDRIDAAFKLKKKNSLYITRGDFIWEVQVHKKGLKTKKKPRLMSKDPALSYLPPLDSAALLNEGGFFFFSGDFYHQLLPLDRRRARWMWPQYTLNSWFGCNTDNAVVPFNLGADEKKNFAKEIKF